LERHSPLTRRRAGYKFSFLDRRELIQALYDNLHDKSKVYVSKELVKVDHLDREVRVITKDGTIFTGDIVVGADGVHSQTREEMWKIAEAEDPSYGSQRLADCTFIPLFAPMFDVTDRLLAISCTYRCMFGISDCPEDIPKETGFKSFHKNHSYLCQSGREGKFYFFAFIKNPQKTVGRSIPRYTADDERAVVDDYGEDIIRPGLTFSDIYQRRRHAVLVPLQEYVLDRCFYKRAILIGDSFHKVCSALRS
jgi:2-polyprenyl-6-methoxyphenol hydroxylase-like FAD-dependent oxidoreductase